jgi:integrase
MARPGQYLYQRKGSQNWYLRLQYPTETIRSAAASLLGREVGPKIEKSLHTMDRREAEVLAGPEILEHKRFLLAVSHMMNPRQKRWLSAEDQAVIEAAYQTPLRRKIVFDPVQPLHPPGTTVRNDDGSMIIATANDLIHLDAQGNQIKTEHNIKVQDKITFATEITSAPHPEFWRAKRVKAADVDHEIVENWISERNPAKTHANAARNMLALFRELHPTKTFETADRDDARAMVAKLEELGNVSATIKSKLSGLVAAVNLEMDQKKPRVKFNPFAGVAKKRAADTTKRMSLDDDDVAKMEARLDLFTPDELLMWQFCLRTGMRPAEVYALSEEFSERLAYNPHTLKPFECRYVWIDRSKNIASTRRIPLPKGLIPYLPAKIDGPMFTTPLDAICGRINDKMRQVGIMSIDPVTKRARKVFYSTRHRCRTRLSNGGIRQDIERWIMGHPKDVHTGQYGDDLANYVKLPWIEYLDPLAKRPPVLGAQER